MATSRPNNPPADTRVKRLPFSFPFRRKGEGKAAGKAITDEHEFHALLKKEASGNYCVSAKGMWHGGIHISEGAAGSELDLKYGVRCIADGEVVAFRVNRKYLVSQIPADGDTPAREAHYSTGFALVRHTMEFPKDNKLTFFSLYMHLQDLAGYERDKTLPRPPYWTPDFKVTQFANDKPARGRAGAASADQVGLRVRARHPHGTPLCILPRGTHVSIGKREGSWGQITDIHGASLIPATVGDYVAPTAATGGWMFLGSEGGHPVAEAVVPESMVDRVVIPAKPVPVKAGDLMGHLGRYDSLNEQAENRMVHIEAFCGDGVQAFIEQGRAWVRNHGFRPNDWKALGLSSEPTLLRVDRNTKLYKEPFNEGATPPITDVVQINAFAELEKYPENKRMETKAISGEKLPWWRITSANALGHEIDGWVRQENFAGGRVTREFAQSWIDFECFDLPHDPTHTMCASREAYINCCRNADVPAPAAMDKLSPLMAKVYRAIYPKGDGSQAARELCAIPEDRWRALRASRLIVKHESEWANPGKWQQLMQEIAKHMGPQPNHQEEQKRIEKLVWWDEVKAGVSDLPGADVFHVHPVGLVGNFGRGEFQFTLAMMLQLFPRADRNALQEVADEFNAHLDVYKLDTPLRRTHFFAQIMQETGPSLKREEGFIWKASALKKTFSYFRKNTDKATEHGYHQIRPIKEDGSSMSQADFEAIANGAYGGRSDLGNGDYESGDGWRYRGRGLKQLTGRANYRYFTDWHKGLQKEWPDEILDFEANPDLLVQPKYAARSAAFFWRNNNLEVMADKGALRDHVDAITRVVNKHTDSYSSRFDNFNSILNRGDLT